MAFNIQQEVRQCYPHLVLSERVCLHCLLQFHLSALLVDGEVVWGGVVADDLIAYDAKAILQ